MPQFLTEYWPDTNSHVTFFPATLQPALPVSAVKIYVFQGNKLLLANITSRGWDLPGGHIETNETPEQALKRELKEETGATIENLKLIGYLKITNEKENQRNKQYPRQSCMLIYKGSGAILEANHNFKLEATESKFVSLEELPYFHHNWNEAKAQVVEYAFGC
jgi:8-oxo-dGTP diphosphatase